MTRPAMIFDVDGTLASCDWRRPFLDGPRPDWVSFNAGQPFDAGVPDVIDLARQARALDLAVVVVSARGSDRRQVLRDWLDKWDVPCDSLFMRSSKDFRPDADVKADILRTFILPRFSVTQVVDDRPAVVAMWRAAGFSVLQVTDPAIPPPLLGGSA